MKTQSNEKVLLLGGDDRSTLAVMRSLGRKAIHCYTLGSKTETITRYSRYLTRTIKTHGLTIDHESFINQLQILMGAHGFDLVLPMDDRMQAIIQRDACRLIPHGKIAVLPNEIFRTVTDKSVMTEIARNNGVNVPYERLVKNKDNVQNVKKEFSLPVVIKPISSIQFDSNNPRRFVQKAFSWEQFDLLISEMIQSGPVSVQSNFVGVGVGVELLLDAGRIVMEFQHRRLHEPIHGGGSSYRISEPVDPILRDAALRLLSPLQFTGVAMVEFKKNLETDEWIFVEVNPRFWGSLPLAITSGADFPFALYKLLVHDTHVKPPKYKIGICSRNWSRDYSWQIENYHAEKNDPLLLTLPIKQVIMETAWNLVTFKERSDSFCFHDPMPFFAELSCICKGTSKKIHDKLKLKYLDSAIFAWSRHRRLLKLVKNARNILFICRGNICRSPFAEYYAKQTASGNLIFNSAGILHQADRLSPNCALSSGKKFGVDLTSHRSKTVSTELINNADIVFIFDYDNYQQLVDSYPKIISKLYFLGEYKRVAGTYISDPYGGTPNMFDSTFNRIKGAIDGIFSFKQNESARAARIVEMDSYTGAP